MLKGISKTSCRDCSALLKTQHPCHTLDKFLQLPTSGSRVIKFMQNDIALSPKRSNEVPFRWAKDAQQLALGSRHRSVCNRRLVERESGAFATERLPYNEGIKFEAFGDARKQYIDP